MSRFSVGSAFGSRRNYPNKYAFVPSRGPRLTNAVGSALQTKPSVPRRELRHIVFLQNLAAGSFSNPRIQPRSAEIKPPRRSILIFAMVPLKQGTSGPSRARLTPYGQETKTSLSADGIREFTA
jgi:hypothetical protein